MRVATPTRILEAATQDGLHFVGLTVNQYDWLIDQRKIAENTSNELIEGMIVKKDRSAVGEDPWTIGDRHRIAACLLAELNPAFSQLGCFN